MFTQNTVRTTSCCYPPLPRSIWIHPYAPPDEYDLVCKSIWLKAKKTKELLDTWHRLYSNNVRLHSSESSDSSDNSDSMSAERDKQTAKKPKKHAHPDTAKTQQHQLMQQLQQPPEEQKQQLQRQQQQQQHKQQQQQQQQQQQKQQQQQQQKQLQQQQQQQQRQKQEQEQIEQQALSKESRLYRFYRSDFRQPLTTGPTPPPRARIETQTIPEESETHTKDERNVVTQKQTTKHSEPVEPIPVNTDRHKTDKTKGSSEVSHSKTEGTVACSSQKDLCFSAPKLARDEQKAKEKRSGAHADTAKIQHNQKQQPPQQPSQKLQQQKQQQRQKQQQEQLKQEALSKESRLYRFYRSDLRQPLTTGPTVRPRPLIVTQTIPEEPETQDERNVVAQESTTKESQTVKPLYVDIPRNLKDKPKPAAHSSQESLSSDTDTTKTSNSTSPSETSPDNNYFTPSKLARYQYESEDEPEISSRYSNTRSSSNDSTFLPSIRSAATDSEDEVVLSDMEDEETEEEEQTSDDQISIRSLDLSQFCTNFVNARQKVVAENVSKKQIEGSRDIPLLTEEEQDPKKRLEDSSLSQNIQRMQLNTNAPTENNVSNAKPQDYKRPNTGHFYQENVTPTTENKPDKDSSACAGAHKPVVNIQNLDQLRKLIITTVNGILSEETTTAKKESCTEETSSSSPNTEFPKLSNTVDAKRKATMNKTPIKQAQGSWKTPLCVKPKQEQEKKKPADNPACRIMHNEPPKNGSVHQQNETKMTEHKPCVSHVDPRLQKNLARPNVVKEDQPKEQSRTFQRLSCPLSAEFPRLCNTVDPKRKAVMENPPKKQIRGPWEIPLSEQQTQEGPSICTGVQKLVVDLQTLVQASQLVSVPISSEPPAAINQLALGDKNTAKSFSPVLIFHSAYPTTV
ncbi:hypothetical protein WMY93_019239 [Mugilogobius chulae]|uniref:Mediator of RNA polymerase II transcription subunit 26 n=1 Tax=Mugilogobius chulae TaxID=88201 RepID=A0AAW0NKK5_9GOBI